MRRIPLEPGRDAILIDNCEIMPQAARDGVAAEAIAALQQLPVAKRFRRVFLQLKELTTCKWQPSSPAAFTECVLNISTTSAQVWMREIEHGVCRIDLHVDVIQAMRLREHESFSKQMRDTILHELTHALTYIANECERLRTVTEHRLVRALTGDERTPPEALPSEVIVRLDLHRLLSYIFLEGIARTAENATKLRWDSEYLHSLAAAAHSDVTHLKEDFGEKLAALRAGKEPPSKDLRGYTYGIGFYMVYLLLYADKELSFTALMGWPVMKFFHEAERTSIALGITPPFSLGNASAGREGLVYTRGKGIFDYNEALALLHAAAKQGRMAPAQN